MEVNTNDLLSLSQAARQLGTTEATLRGKARRGQLETVRIGAALFVTKTELDEYRKRQIVHK